MTRSDHDQTHANDIPHSSSLDRPPVASARIHDITDGANEEPTSDAAGDDPPPSTTIIGPLEDPYETEGGVAAAAAPVESDEGATAPSADGDVDDSDREARGSGAPGGGDARRRTRSRCDPYGGNRDALGWALDAVTRGAAIMGAAVFVSTALLNLAKEAAGCGGGGSAATAAPSASDAAGGEDSGEDCTGKVYGMRPSSLLTAISLTVGLASACLMPLVGSVVDHTRYRRAVGRISGVVMSVVSLLQVFISSETWFIIAISQVFLALSYSIHLCVVLAYLPELTDNKEELVRWNSSFVAVQYLSSVVFLVVMVVATSLEGIQDDDVASARLSQVIVFILCAIFFGWAWTTLFQARPASQSVPEGSNLVTAGFVKLYRTFRNILSKHKAIKWCLLSVSLTEAAVAAFVTIGITFMTDQLQFSATQNGIAILILLVSSVPGTKIASFVSNRWNPIRSLQVCLLVWTMNTTIAAAVLQGPGQQTATYCFSVIWGAATGWVYPTERSLYCTIIPKGQEGRLMGTYLCSCQILSWLPPLVFTAMNENGVSMRLGVASLNIYFILSFLVLFRVGSYSEAVQHAERVVSTATSAPLRVDSMGMDASDAESPLRGDATEHKKPL